eukprot:470459-Alexandrium_andersonii.AAC.1
MVVSAFDHAVSVLAGVAGRAIDQLRQCLACLVMRFMCPDVFHVLRTLSSGLMLRLTVSVAKPAVMDGVAAGGKECSARRQHQGHRPPRGQ